MPGILERITVSLLVLSVGVPAGAAREVTYRCRIDGQVRAVCCCRGPELIENHPQQGRQESQVDAPCSCCDIRVSETSGRAAAIEPGTSHETSSRFPLVSPATPATPLSSGSEFTAASVLAHRPSLPLRLGTPLFIWNCVYLI